MKVKQPVNGSVARATASVKAAALPELGEGVVECMPTVYDVEYRMGFLTWHNILAGAFEESIAEQESIPIFWMHGWDWTEQVPIGHSIEAESNDKGVRLVNQFYVEESDTARSVYRGLVAGSLREWSIGYRILEHSVREEDDKTILDIAKAELMEASSVLRGANPQTETLKVASALAGGDASPAALRAALSDLLAELGVDLTAREVVAGEFGKEDLAKVLGVAADDIDKLAAFLQGGIDLAGVIAGEEDELEPEPFIPDPARLAALLANPSAREALRPNS